MNLTHHDDLRALLDRHGLRPRKGLGQHFLCSEAAVSAVLGCLEEYRSALEIGPGPGVLTQSLSERLETTLALEIDPGMISALQESAPRATVLRQDALKADLAGLLQPLPSPRAVVSNMPYYITGALVQTIAEARNSYDKAVLMMQREVAYRFLASPGDGERASISVYLQTLFEIRKVADVPASAFLPPPKVDSTILEFVPKEFNLSNFRLNPEDFFAFVRKGFSQPRKTLANNLAGAHERATVASAIESAGLTATVRPHQLTLEQWISVAVVVM